MHIVTPKIGRLMTKPIEDHRNKEGGFFELDVITDLDLFIADRDKPGFIRNEIARHFAQCIKSTEIPPEHWGFEAEPWIQERFNYPPFTKFGK